MIKGKTTKFRLNDTTYDIGVPFSGLSKEEEARLVAEGVAEYVEVPVTISNTQQSPKPPGGPNVSNINAKAAITLVGSINSIEDLNKLGIEETEGKKRATVINAISEKIAELEAKKDENPEDPDAKVPLNLNLDPNDVIVS